MNNLEPKIYVACLAAYNEGILYGKWIDATQTVDQILEDIKAMLSYSPIPNAEEFAIHSYADFGSIKLNESEDIEQVVEMAEFISLHGSLGAEVIIHANRNIDEAQFIIEDCYHGEYDSEKEFVEILTEEIGDVPDHLSYYIDYEAMARDYFINDYFSICIDHKVHVFNHY